MYECMHVRLCECKTVWLYITGVLDETDNTSKMGGGPTSQYNHSTNFIGYDIIGDKKITDGVKPGAR
jgi:hypothetical protein